MFLPRRPEPRREEEEARSASTEYEETDGQEEEEAMRLDDCPVLRHSVSLVLPVSQSVSLFG
jgi:hypothetical protein